MTLRSCSQSELTEHLVPGAWEPGCGQAHEAPWEREAKRMNLLRSGLLPAVGLPALHLSSSVPGPLSPLRPETILSFLNVLFCLVDT